MRDDDDCDVYFCSVRLAFYDPRVHVYVHEKSGKKNILCMRRFSRMGNFFIPKEQMQIV
jgi:hypothetical protein